jgi:FtsH-binding integral membrane protein
VNQYGQRFGSPSQLGVRPTTALSTAFLSQAFFWMFLGLLATTAVGCLVSQMSETQLFKISGLFLPLILVQLGIGFGLQLAIKRISALVGLALFFAYAALTGVTLGFALRLYTDLSVASAGLSEAAVFGGAAIYGRVTRRDLSGIAAYVFMALFGVIAATFLNLLIFHSETGNLIMSVAVVLIFTFLTAYSVQRIQRGDIAAWAGSMEKGAVLGAFLLYLDFINLFFALLRIMGNRR